MLETENWSKQHVHYVMRELLYSFNYVWFLMEDWAQRNCPEKAEGEDFKKIAETFGAYEAKRLEKTVDQSLQGVDLLIAFLKHSHWCAFEDIELVKLSESRLRMRTLDCTAQKAAKKWGKDCYDCSITGLRLRKGFLGQINPDAAVSRVFSPPDPRPEDIPAGVSCQWIVSLR